MFQVEIRENQVYSNENGIEMKWMIFNMIELKQEHHIHTKRDRT